MTAICFYFQVHQPFRVRPYQIFDVGHDHAYFDHHPTAETDNRLIAQKVANKCYLPTTQLLLDLLQQHPEMKLTFSISGIALEQFERYTPEVIELFQRLAATGRVEFLAETYYHSLAFLYSQTEFNRQVKMHQQKIHDLFGQIPTAFRNTELIYYNDLAQAVSQLGYKVILAEGADHILQGRSPNFLYHPPGKPETKLLLKNYQLSDDIAFRFSERSWSEWPLTAEKFAHWVSAINGSGQIVNLFMDYETIGEHQWEETGIFEFFRHLPEYLKRHPDNQFVTVSQAAELFHPVDQLDVPHPVSWADTERDLSAWLDNPMQQNALKAIYNLEDKVLKTGDLQLISDWRKLQTSDHFYYMCTKWFADGDVHKYFSPYSSPYEAFTNYMNVLHDIKYRLSNL